MDEIYVVCTCLQKESGGCDYDPAVDPESRDKIQMLACDNLVALQRERADAIEALREIADVIIVPVSLQTYQQLEDSLNGLVEEVGNKLDDAAAKIADAYKIMGIEADIEALKAQMMEQATSCGSTGKVLNENLEIVDRASDYITADMSDDYYDGWENEEDDDYEEDDEDDYEDEEEFEDDYEDEDEEEDENESEYDEDDEEEDE